MRNGYCGWILSLLVCGCILQEGDPEIQENDPESGLSADLVGVWGLSSDVFDNRSDSGTTGILLRPGTTLEFREDGTFREWSVATVFMPDTTKSVLYTLTTGSYRYSVDESLVFEDLDCMKYDADADSLQALSCEALNGCARPEPMSVTVDSVDGFPPNPYSCNRMMEVRRSGGSGEDSLVCRRWKRKVWEELSD